MEESGERITLADRVIALMSDDEEWTLATIHQALGSTVGQLRRVVRPLVESGLIRVCGTVGPQHEKKYQLTPEIELDRCCSTPAPWWPVADSTVNNAMSAMVRLNAAERADTGVASPE
ncbi:helix-turn-helix transcriptional regulator [Burkholderia diffusa]|uniref:helix-turn-helix transcriptional regulator n=1 Tax=Burkholderia diffusa TaxID=488732 RepID=UPI0012D8F261|nr:helix-turn-helix transcriptional regulator [Burkholderia diffusa]